MNQQVLSEIYDLLKEGGALYSAVENQSNIKYFNPNQLEKHLISKFGKPLVLNTFKELFNNEVFGIRSSDQEYYIKEYKKKSYFIYWDRLNNLLLTGDSK